MGQSPATTLYDDWRFRRERLLAESAQASDGYREVLVKLLDYLLKRYENDGAARRPARFPLSSEVVWKRRTMVVHRHLGCVDHPIIRDVGDASVRASRVLSRIVAQTPQEGTRTPGGGALGAGDLVGLVSDSIKSIPETICSMPFRPRSMRRYVREHFLQLERSNQDALMSLWFGQLMPTDVEPPDWSISKRQQAAWENLSGCGHPDVHKYVFALWREYARLGQRGDWDAQLVEFLRRPGNRERTAEVLRAELANDRPTIRLRALTLLRELGSLDDVGLLSDLLALPKQEDEGPNEREAMLETLKTLAGP
jgi:hypothetical protein